MPSTASTLIEGETFADLNVCDWTTEQYLDLQRFQGSDGPVVPSKSLAQWKSHLQYNAWSRLYQIYTEGDYNVFFLLKEMAYQLPNKPVVIWLDRKGNRKTTTFSELIEQVRSISSFLIQDLRLRRGDRALLCYEPGPQFYATFWACLAVGVIAVPVCPPDPFNPHSDVGRKLENIIKDAQPAAFLTSTLFAHAMASASIMRGHGTGDSTGDRRSVLEGRDWHTTDNRPAIPELDWPMERTPELNNAEEIAFLQYTSGSTGNAKGVMVSHRCLQTNGFSCLQMTHSADSFECFLNSVAVSWLPTFHDMGLIGFHICLATAGSTLVGFSPLDFIADPIMWLKEMKNWNRVITGAPPFALDLCVRRVTPSDMKEIDLSRVEGLVLGAEPIVHTFLDSFNEQFKASGFSDKVFLPCYGMAENVLYVTGKHSVDQAPARIYVDRASLQTRGQIRLVHKETASARCLVSSGDVVSGEATSDKKFVSIEAAEGGKFSDSRWNEPIFVIVDPETGAELSDGTIGEIWITGPSKAMGYWNNQAATRETFKAVLTKSVKKTSEAFLENRTEFLRSGDVGVLVESNLYITGRIKDMIILNGANYYPSDIEEVVQKAHSAVKQGGVAAVSVNVQGSERMVVLIELRDPARDSLLGKAKKALLEGVLMLATTLPPTFTQTALRVYANRPTLPPGFMTGALFSVGLAMSWTLRQRMDALTLVLLCYSAYLSSLAFLNQKKPSSAASTKQDASVPSLSRQASTLIDVYGEPELKAILKLVRLTIIKEFGVSLHEVVLLAPRTISKTSSGKLSHALTRMNWIDDKLASSVLMTSKASTRASIKRNIKEAVVVNKRAESKYDESSEDEASVSDSFERVDSEETPSFLAVDSADYKALFKKTKAHLIKIAAEELGGEMVDDEESPGKQLSVSELLQSKSFDHDATLDQYGLDSLSATKLADRVTNEFTLEVPLSVFMFLTDPSLNGVTRVIVQLLQTKAPVVSGPTAKTTAKLSDFNTAERIPCILGIGTAVPSLEGSQEEIIEGMIVGVSDMTEKGKNTWRKIGVGSKIDRRHSCMPNATDFFWGRKGLGNDAPFEERNEYFKTAAPVLAIAAARKALDDWGGDYQDITHVVAVTCTGIIIPGLEFHIMQGLGLPDTAQRLSVQFMGCFGALSGMKAGKALAAENPTNRVLVVCCELCTLHMQMNEKVDNMVANALFADGSGAFVLGCLPTPSETVLFEVLKDQSVIIPKTLDHMAWEVSQTGMIIGLSKHIPTQIYEHMNSFSDRLLSVTNARGRKKTIARENCTWAIHPGGPMIIQAIIDALEIDPGDASAAWEVLRANGNMSSATLVFLWDHLRKQPYDANKSWVPAFAFGPGLNVEGTLLRRHNPKPTQGEYL